MLAQRPAPATSAFNRRDLRRLLIGGIFLTAALTAIFALDLLPQRLDVAVGGVAAQDIAAPRTQSYVSEVLTNQARDEARRAVEPVYDFSDTKADRIATEQVAAFERRVVPIDTAFKDDTTPDDRQTLLESVPGLGEDSRATLAGVDAETWQAIRREAQRVLDVTERKQIRDTGDVETTRAGLSGQMVGLENREQRNLAADLISSLVVPNSSYSAELTSAAQAKAADEVPNVVVDYSQSQVIVRRGEKITPEILEAINEFHLTDSQPDVARLGGWFLLAVLIVGVLFGWVWRFRRQLWHRSNALVLIGLILVGMALLLKVTAGRAGLPFLLPSAAAGMLLAILLDASVATFVTAILAVVAGAVNGNEIEFAAYLFFGGMAGVIAIRRGDRFQVFLQAGLIVAIVNVLVVAMFGFLGSHDARGVIELMGAGVLSAAGSAIAAVGSFAVLGSVFGILTVFQLLELANPSQPLLRRLLIETPGTYHHSLMVGNLAERAAEAIGADPLLTRVAAYYHDVGKLANPMAFIENQAGGENIHDELDPETSAHILKAHTADGIDVAYKAKLPKGLIAYIPQHHGTAIMSYFFARAKGLAAEPYGGLQTADGQRAAASVDERKFRHSGPKPQTREAALIMLADGVEASVRSLASRDEPAIRAMVERIIDERMSDGQFDECDLTLRDVEKIKTAFVEQLLGMYHQRIAYPQNKVVELESRRNAGAGTGA